MELTPFITGLGLGFTIAAAVGPISILTIRRTLAHGRGVGLATGLGVALADATYGAIAALGLTLITDALVGAALPLRLFGGAFLIWLGIRTLRSQPADLTAGGPNGSAGRTDLATAFGSGYLLTMSNPMTVLSFASIFAGAGLASSTGGALTMVAGIFLGSLAWWLVLTTAVTAVRGRLGARHLRWANIVSGAVITGFGIVAVVAGLVGLAERA